MTDIELGKRLKTARTGASLSQIELSKQLGITDKTLRNYEKGNNITVDFIKKVAYMCNTNFYYLLEGNETMNVSNNLNEHQRLKYIVDNSNLSISQFAQKIDIDSDTIEAIIIGQQKLSPQIARNIDDNYTYNPNWVLYGKGSMYVKTSSDMTGDINKSNSFNEKEINIYEDELLEAYRKLSNKKREYYYFKIKSDALEEEFTKQ